MFRRSLQWRCDALAAASSASAAAGSPPTAAPARPQWPSHSRSRVDFFKKLARRFPPAPADAITRFAFPKPLGAALGEVATRQRPPHFRDLPLWVSRDAVTELELPLKQGERWTTATYIKKVAFYHVSDVDGGANVPDVCCALGCTSALWTPQGWHPVDSDDSELATALKETATRLGHRRSMWARGRMLPPSLATRRPPQEVSWSCRQSFYHVSQIAKCPEIRRTYRMHYWAVTGRPLRLPSVDSYKALHPFRFPLWFAPGDLKGARLRPVAGAEPLLDAVVPSTHVCYALDGTCFTEEELELIAAVAGEPAPSAYTTVPEDTHGDAVVRVLSRDLTWQVGATANGLVVPGTSYIEASAVQQLSLPRFVRGGGMRTPAPAGGGGAMPLTLVQMRYRVRPFNVEQLEAA